MDSLMLMRLPGRQLYCLMPTDQYYVFQQYYIRRRSSRSPRDIRHAEISRYTHEASGSHKNDMAHDLRIPRRMVTAFTLKMRRVPFLRLDNCATVRLKLSDGTDYRFAVLGVHTDYEIRTQFQSAGSEGRAPFAYYAPATADTTRKTGAAVQRMDAKTPLTSREARRERVMARLEDRTLRRRESHEYLMIMLAGALAVTAFFFSVTDGRRNVPSGTTFPINPVLSQVICYGCILALLFLPALVPEWYSLFLNMRGGKRLIPTGFFVIWPAAGLIYLTFCNTVYLSLPLFFLIACIPGAVIALAVWLVSWERGYAPVRLTLFCCALAVLLVGIGGRINRYAAGGAPEHTETVKIVGEGQRSDWTVLKVRIDGADRSVFVYNSDRYRNNAEISMDFYDGSLGIPFAQIRDPARP